MGMCRWCPSENGFAICNGDCLNCDKMSATIKKLDAWLAEFKQAEKLLEQARAERDVVTKRMIELEQENAKLRAELAKGGNYDS